jgi:hypothetical protein
VFSSSQASLHSGFSKCLVLKWVYTKSKLKSGTAIDFYAAVDTITQLKDQHQLLKSSPKINYNIFDHWEDFLVFTREVKKDDLFLIICSRRGQVSYQNSLEKLPHYLSKYFSENSFIMVYPKQIDHGIKMDDVQHFDGRLVETISDKVSSVGKVQDYLKKVFRNEKKQDTKG